MTDVTIKSLAIEINIPLNILIQQLAKVGINKATTDSITQKEKEALFAYFSSKGIFLQKLTLQRKTRCVLNVFNAGGKNKLVQIEIRKKCTYQRDLQLLKAIEKNENVFHQKNKEDSQYKMLDNQKENINKKQYIDKELFKNNEIKQKIFITTTNNKITEKKDDNINNITKSLQNKKNYYVSQFAKKKYNPEKEIFHKNEKDLFYNAKKEQTITNKHNITWKSAFIKTLEKEKNDRHISALSYIKKIENENNLKTEDGRRYRSREYKIINKQKKTNRIFESKSYNETERILSRSNKNKKKLANSLLTQSFNKPIQLINKDIIINETITVAELANKMAVKGSQVIKTLIKFGSMVTINQVLDQETAQLVVEEMGHKAILRCENELENLIISDRDVGEFSTSKLRAPIVTIMGHVDHGKTSLLDYIRSTKIAKNEAGGITQHIGAYHVKTKNGAITFLDTPGHAAFTAMRARGAQVTDIIILVIAADDGVMPQTIEAIQHAKAAKVPIVVAINKIDSLEADSERIKNELTQYEILSEEWGGETQFINTSAKTGKGINDLLDAILLQSEILELKAVYNGMAKGIVIESFLDKGRGPVATILVREGTLKQGDVVLCGFEYGRIRAMRNELNQNILSAGPSIPIEIFGLSGIPLVGDDLMVVRSEKKAREVAFYRRSKIREIKLARQQKVKLDNIFINQVKDKISELNIILKSDVQGSVEAINNVLKNLSTDEVKIKIIGLGIGDITETDAMLAIASNAILIGFNVRADSSARKIIDTENLKVYYYSVIYDLINEIKLFMNGMLMPKFKQEIVGLAEVRNIFRLPKLGVIAGCRVIEGIIKRNNKLRILRKNIIVYEGELESLRHFKDDVYEVHNGMECGISIKNYNDVYLGDLLEVFENIEIKRIIE